MRLGERVNVGPFAACKGATREGREDRYDGGTYTRIRLLSNGARVPVKRTHKHGKFSKGGIRDARQTPIFRPRLRMIGSLAAKAVNIPYIKRARTRDKWESNRY